MFLSVYIDVVCVYVIKRASRLASPCSSGFIRCNWLCSVTNWWWWWRW